MSSCSSPIPRSANRVSSIGFELAELLGASDVVSLHCPLIRLTRHLIDQSALQLMRPHAVLVNTSRGGVVDEEH